MKNNSSYLGAQAKWSTKGIWYKRDLVGGEAVAETLVSLFLESCVNIENFGSQGLPFVPYRVSTEDKRICLSPNFLREGETFISLYDVMKSFKPKRSEHSDFKGKLEYIDSFYKRVLGHSCKR